MILSRLNGCWEFEAKSATWGDISNVLTSRELADGSHSFPAFWLGWSCAQEQLGKEKKRVNSLEQAMSCCFRAVSIPPDSGPMHGRRDAGGTFGIWLRRTERVGIPAEPRPMRLALASRQLPHELIDQTQPDSIELTVPPR